MKATAAHPDYKPSKITCACGMVFDTFSTRGDFGIDVCSNCHPFYTGKQKLLDSAGRVDLAHALAVVLHRGVPAA